MATKPEEEDALPAPGGDGDPALVDAQDDAALSPPGSGQPSAKKKSTCWAWRLWKRSRVFGHQGKDVIGGVLFSAYPDKVVFRREFLIRTSYGTWMQRDGRRGFAIISLCLSLFILFQPAMPWETTVMGRGMHVVTVEGVVYERAERPVLVEVVFCCAQAWLGFTLLHFVTADLFLRLIFAFETIVILTCGVVFMASWILLYASMFPDDKVWIFFQCLSQLAKLPGLLVLASMDSVRMKRWLKVTVLVMISVILLFEHGKVAYNFVDIIDPEMGTCVYGIRCQHIVDMHTKSMWTCAIFVLKASFRYFMGDPFAVVRPRFRNNSDWDVPHHVTRSWEIRNYSSHLDGSAAASAPTSEASAATSVSSSASAPTAAARRGALRKPSGEDSIEFATALTAATAALVALAASNDGAGLSESDRRRGLQELAASAATAAMQGVGRQYPDLVNSWTGLLEMQPGDQDAVVASAATAARDASLEIFRDRNKVERTRNDNAGLAACSLGGAGLFDI